MTQVQTQSLKNKVAVSQHVDETSVINSNLEISQSHMEFWRYLSHTDSGQENANLSHTNNINPSHTNQISIPDSSQVY